MWSEMIYLRQPRVSNLGLGPTADLMSIDVYMLSLEHISSFCPLPVVIGRLGKYEGEKKTRRTKQAEGKLGQVPSTLVLSHPLVPQISLSLA